MQKFILYSLQVLLMFIWLRRYPTLHHLAMHFGIPVTSVHRIIHRLLPRMHVYFVQKYIKWHSMNHWRNLAGTFPEWPSTVAILDCCPFRICKPKGAVQSLYYRKDRHTHFLNWLLVVDVLGFYVYSRPGFLGHLNDSTCLR